MWPGKIKKKIHLAILLVIFVVPILTETATNQAENPDPFFSISILALIGGCYYYIRKKSFQS